MGDFPMMTQRGTFIINGTERVVVSQLVRSPGVYFSRELDKTSDRYVYIAKIIPGRGAWLEFDVDKKDTVGVRIDRKRRQNVTVLLKALGWSADEILAIFDQAPSVQLTLDKDHVETQEEALEDIYRKLRPGEPPTAESAKTLLENLFFNPKRYDLAKVGRHKVDKKLGAAQGELAKQLRAHHKALGELDNPDRKGFEQFKARVFSAQLKEEQVGDAPKYKGVLTYEDMLKTVGYLVKLHAGEEGYDPDDIDHFGNRRLRSVGELIQNQIRIGLSRMERVVKERMTTQDVEAITPQTLINIRPVVASIKEFFGTSQLSQFMDQTNTLAGLTHKRRLSALGPGGLSRERAGFEVRDVHPSHYGRMCPIETPEGPEHRPDRFAVELRPHQPVRVHRDPVPARRGGQGHDEDRLPVRRRGGPPRHRAGEHRRTSQDRQARRPVLVRRKGGEVDSVPPDRGRLHGRVAEAARVGRRGADPVPGARRRQPGPDGREHAAAGRAAAAVRGPARRAPAWSSARRWTPATWWSPRSPASSTTSRPSRSWSRSDAASSACTSCIKFRRSNQGTNINQKPIVAGRGQGHEGPGHRRRPVDRGRRDRARQEPRRRLHAVGGPQLRGRDHPVGAARQGGRPHVDPHRGARGRRPRHEARRRGDHPRHPQRLRGDPEGPRRARDRADRCRGQPRRLPGRQGHPQGRDGAHARGAAAPRHLR